MHNRQVPVHLSVGNEDKKKEAPKELSAVQKVPAKALLKFGEWGKWLEESVDFSQSRANKLMRIFKEYGSGQPTSSNSDPDPNLNYSQAVLLLGIPKEERAQFIIDMDVEGMTKQELRQAVNERTQTLQEKDQVLQEKDQALQENAGLQKTVEDQSGFITGLTAELANLKVQCSREVFPSVNLPQRYNPNTMLLIILSLITSEKRISFYSEGVNIQWKSGGQF